MTPGAAGIAAADPTAWVLVRDANLIILNKPAGIAVHRGPRARVSLEDLLPRLRFGLRHVPALGHRLDHDTSGCLVLARHPKALSRLGRLFAAGLIEKRYWAVVAGEPAAAAGLIDLPLLKARGPHGWKVLPDPTHGQRALTDWRVLGRAPGRTWLELAPRTGRTHQIRVHLKAMGWPILGDPVYGPTPDSTGTEGPLLLHARRVAVPYWEGRPPVVGEAPPPPAFSAALAGFPAPFSEASHP